MTVTSSRNSLAHIVGPIGFSHILACGCVYITDRNRPYQLDKADTINCYHNRLETEQVIKWYVTSRSAHVGDSLKGPVVFALIMSTGLLP